jgi:hypothetical protein
MSRELNSKIRAHRKALAQMILLIKQQNRAMTREREQMDQLVNATREQMITGARRASYTRELEMMMAKLHFDIARLMLGMEIARLNTVTTSLVSSHKLCEILQEVVLRMQEGYSLLAAVRPETMHIFYATSAISAVATKGRFAS